ncbi:hypothetical protein HY490_03885 [Candidatus Woesearchaeota archaeon]|nr:hypothetical protein [Candidatus Woesearchaeota archaeon]
MTGILVNGRSPDEMYRRLLEEVASQPDVPPNPLPSVITPHAGFFIDDLPGKKRYRLHNVVVDEEPFKGLWVLEWGKQLLCGGEPHRQDEWSELTKSEEEKVSPAPFVIATIFALHDNQNTSNVQQRDLVHCVKEMFKDDFDPTKPYKMSSTRLAYVPAQNVDITQHWYGYPIFQRDVSKNIAGPNGYIGSGFEDFTEATLGTRNIGKLEQSIVWLTGKRPYAYRLNKSKNREERALVLGCYGNGFGVADGSIYGSRPARGLVAVRAQNGVSQ